MSAGDGTRVAQHVDPDDGDAICAAVLELVVRVRARHEAKKAEGDAVARAVRSLMYRMRDEVRA